MHYVIAKPEHRYEINTLLKYQGRGGIYLAYIMDYKLWSITYGP